MRCLSSSASAAIVLATLALTANWNPPVWAQDSPIGLEDAFPYVTFERPLGIQHANDGSTRLYIVEHEGRIKVLEDDSTATEASIFLDLSDRISVSPGGEMYGLAFHPNYKENGQLFVRYKLLDPHRTILSRFERSAENLLVADPATELVLFEIETPDNQNNHHGGDITFGLDGYLYVPLGDGGVFLDAAGNAQNRSSLLGKVLRLDVDNPGDGRNYGIPPDNPFVGNIHGWREEIFAVGFRNPWRLTIDRETGDVWVGDVGESGWEEVDRVEPGHNYGWPIVEGPVCLLGGDGCERDGLSPPVWSYSHEEGITIIGGYVYRGDAVPELQGKYLYVDHATTFLWALHAPSDDEPENELLMKVPFNVSAFGEDASGELLVTDFFRGKIARIVPATRSDAEGEEPASPLMTLATPYPNPSSTQTTIRFTMGSGSSVRLTLHDMLGRTIRTLFENSVGPGQTREVVISTSNLSSGVYVCRLSVGSSVLVQKLVVAR